MSLIKTQFPQFFNEDSQFEVSESLYPGWIPILFGMCTDLHESGHFLKFTLIKEKFGGLRVHYNTTENRTVIDLIINEYNTRSETSCTTCGSFAEVVNIGGGYYLPKCKKHDPNQK